MTLDRIPADLVITTADIQSIGLCIRGIRPWAKANGFDFVKFVKEGIPARDVFATGDEFALRAIKVALEKRNGR